MENYLSENRHLRFAEICDGRQGLQYIYTPERDADTEEDLVACKSLKWRAK